ncbi:CIS tube protein, partial [Zoogloea ramigera]|uniref:CIS tube protein n=1 Tax=Zoogloea ramigera TaxID=350 RepID=UPI001142FF26
MTTSQFRRAKLVPFDAGGRNPQEARAIPLDFNPETLTLKVSGGEQRDRSRRGRQQVQNVGASKATLSFECIFDSTRPRDASDSSTGGEEMLDVRTRSKPIADLLQVYGSGREQAPRRVQFRWGTLIFNGVISQHQEVFDYFSPSGVPLRSKLSITLTEQEFRYEVSATDAAQRRQAVEQASAGARSQAAAAGASSLMGGGSGLDLSAGFDLSAGLGLDLDLDLNLNLDMSLSAQVGLSASLGLSADIGVSVGAGINLDASAAVDLFGPAALGTDADLGRSGVAIPQPSPGLAAAGVPPSPWAPDGPAPGSRA